MALEIEHKYLIQQELWKKVIPSKSVSIKQGYLSTDPNKTIRVRTLGDKGYLTIKGKTSGATRKEFEYEVPLRDAEELLNLFGEYTIEKIRHYVTEHNKLWEVDEFQSLNKGLFIAEIELLKEDEEYVLPVWVATEVTTEQRYANSNLALQPFSTW